jgi:hypothetical protein
MKLINAGARCRQPKLTGAESLSGPVSSPAQLALELGEAFAHDRLGDAKATRRFAD